MEKKNKAYDKKKYILGPDLGFTSSEAYKLLRTNLEFCSCGHDGGRVIGITSTLKGEGKTTTAINTAYAIAQAGKKVMILDGDMRLPQIGKILKLGDKKGLADLLAGNAALEEVLTTRILDLDNLNAISSGSIPPNPSELLASGNMKALLDRLILTYDYVIIDLPPVLVVSDCLTLNEMLDGVAVVVRSELCDKRSLAEAMLRLKSVQIKILGFVVNDIDEERDAYGRYGRYGRYSRYGKYGRYGNYYDYGYAKNTGDKKKN